MKVAFWIGYYKGVRVAAKSNLSYEQKKARLHEARFKEFKKNKAARAFFGAPAAQLPKEGVVLGHER